MGKQGEAFVWYSAKQRAKILIKEVVDKINIESLEKIQSEDSIKMNDIGNVIIKVQNDIVFDTYESNKVLGSFIIIDTDSNNTVAAGIIN